MMEHEKLFCSHMQACVTTRAAVSYYELIIMVVRPGAGMSALKINAEEYGLGFGIEQKLCGNLWLSHVEDASQLQL